MKKDYLKGKYGDWALITGASSGIGKEFATCFSKLGIKTLVTSNEKEALQDVASTIIDTYGTQCIPVYGDLSQSAFLEKLVQTSAKHEPGIIVNNAGYGMMGYFIQHTFDDYRKLLKVNEETVLYLTHYFCHRLHTQKRKGAIINIASANADFFRGIPFSAVYSASKSFIKNFTEAAYFEMKPFGIDMLSVSPGPTKTSFQNKAKTNTLSFAESPANVVQKSLKALGKKPSIITNKYTKLLIVLYHLFPMPGPFKTKFRAWLYRSVLGKKELIHL
jgi:short-subunit dehydrogenase